MLIKYENDSRKVTKGQTFVAIAGHTVDGHDYIESAIANGAERLIISKPGDYQIPYELVDDTEKYLKEALVKDYSSNFNDLNFIGITGTNGKTTSCYLIYQMLKCLGEKSCLYGNDWFLL